jgi:hypothetical protein
MTMCVQEPWASRSARIWSWNATAMPLWTGSEAGWASWVAAWLSRVPVTASTMIMLASAIRPAIVSVARRSARGLLFIGLPPRGQAACAGGGWVERARARTTGRAVRCRRAVLRVRVPCHRPAGAAPDRRAARGVGLRAPTDSLLPPWCHGYCGGAVTQRPWTDDGVRCSHSVGSSRKPSDTSSATTHPTACAIRQPISARVEERRSRASGNPVTSGLASSRHTSRPAGQAAARAPCDEDRKRPHGHPPGRSSIHRAMYLAAL